MLTRVPVVICLFVSADTINVNIRSDRLYKQYVMRQVVYTLAFQWNTMLTYSDKSVHQVYQPEFVICALDQSFYI